MRADAVNSFMATPPAALTRRQEDFAEALSRAQQRTPQTPRERARETAEQYVALALVQPVLKQAREARSSAPPFGQSQAERSFGAIGDAVLARRMVTSSNWPLVDRLAKDLTRNLPGGGA